jgi:hypothetical protein
VAFDTQLLQYCDHRVIEEDHVVDSSDRKTVYLDQPIANNQNVLVRVNGTPWDRNNKIETLFEDDVTSQVTGSNNIFVASNIPLYDGSNKKRLATRPVDVVVQVTVSDEDASAQFTGALTDTLLVTQHRPLMSLHNIYAIELTHEDIEVKVNTVVVDVVSIEPMFGKIILENAPPIGATVTVSYTYRAKVLSINANDGRVTVKEKPSVGQNVFMSYFYLKNDGWQINTSALTQSSVIIFDQLKQTNHAISVDEDVSSQFDGLKNYCRAQHYPFLPPRASLKTQPIQTLITQVIVKVNSELVTPTNLDAENGYIYLDFNPEPTDTVLITYNYRSTAATDTISVDYQVVIGRCRKCRRVGQLNDYGYDKLGLLTTVVREQKMLQDLLKIVAAIKGSNTAHPWYGTSLVSYIGTARPSTYYVTKFKGEIIGAGENMKDLQRQQTQYQQVDDEEFFSFLDNIDVQQSDVDPDFYEINATVISQAATSIPLTTSLKFNGPLFVTNPMI